MLRWSGMMSGGKTTVKFPNSHLKEASLVVVSKGHVAMLLIGDCHGLPYFIIVLNALEK